MRVAETGQQSKYRRQLKIEVEMHLHMYILDIIFKAPYVGLHILQACLRGMEVPRTRGPSLQAVQDLGLFSPTARQRASLVCS